MRLFLDRGHPQERRVEGQSFQRMVDTFMLWRDQIGQPDPERAIQLGFLIVASILRDLVILIGCG